ncbi:MAG TPA: hypothetical protein VGP82_06710 [Ktedonobacterales bacterium]|nr:hypothetical protein [Ktedonobacterales bacterium]
MTWVRWFRVDALASSRQECSGRLRTALSQGTTRIASVLVALLVVATITACGQTLSASGAQTQVQAYATPPRATATPAVSATPTVDSGAPEWIPLTSSAPAAVLAAIKQSTLFNLNCPPGGDCQQDLTHLGTPTLVTELRTPTTTRATDFYIMPILDAAGDVTAVAAAELNAAHTALQVAGISGNGPRWPNLVTAAGAIAVVQAQHHTGLRSGTHPHLVWMPFDTSALETGRIVWSAGGKGPQDPVWLVPGTDGNDHVVGTDGRAYYLRQIPLSQAQP